MYFSIGRDTELFLYGAGEQGRRLYALLLSRGFSVCCFIDQHVNSLGEPPVLSLDTIGKRDISKDAVVIICLANGMLHDEVAGALNRVGFEQICYLPMRVHSNAACVCQMTTSVNALLQQGDPEGLTFPFYEEIARALASTEHSPIISSSTSHHIVWVDSSLIFTLNRAQWQGDRAKVFLPHSLCDVPIACLTEYIELFQYFSGVEFAPSGYCNLFTISHAFSVTDGENRLDERAALFRSLKERLERGISSFAALAPAAQWNPKGYFNLLDGHHRVSFLLSQNVHKVPLAITQDDYTKWVTNIAPCEFADAVHVDLPVEHPRSSYTVPQGEYGGIRMLSVIQRALRLLVINSSEISASISTLDISLSQGYLARSFCRMFAPERTVCLDPNSRQARYAALLCNLPDIEVRAEFCELKNSSFDLTVIHQDAFQSLKGLSCDALATITERFLFIIFDEGAVESMTCKILDGRLFNRYERVHRVFREGRRMEIGFFEKR